MALTRQHQASDNASDPSPTLGEILALNDQSDPFVARFDALQDRIRSTKPFKTPHDNEVRNLTFDHPKESVRCVERTQLIESLAIAIHIYEEGNSWLDAHHQQMQQRVFDASATIAVALQVYQELRAKDRLSKESRMATKGLRHDTITKHECTVLRVARSLTTDDFVEVVKMKMRPTWRKQKLVSDMTEAFTQYGPHPQNYPAKAMYKTIAIILIDFDIETGDANTVADRLYKRARRTVKSSHL